MKKIFSFSHAFYDRKTFEPVAAPVTPVKTSGPVIRSRNAAISRFNRGTMQAFMHTSEFKYHQEEYMAALDGVVTFAHVNAKRLDPVMPPQKIAQIQEDFGQLKDHLLDKEEDFFSDHKPIVHGQGKELFQTFDALLKSQNIPLQRKMDAITSMAPSMPMCSGGVLTAVQASVTNLKYAMVGLKGAAQLKKTQLVEAAVLEFVQKTHTYKAGDEVHFVNAYFNIIATELGIPGRTDPLVSIAHSEIAEIDFDACRLHVLTMLKPHTFAKLMAEDYLDRIRASIIEAGFNVDKPFEGESLTTVFNIIQNLKLGEMDQEFGQVPDHCFLLLCANEQEDSHGETLQYRLPESSTGITQHFIKLMGSEGLVNHYEGIRLTDSANSCGKIRVMGDFLWIEKDGELADATLKDLLAVQPFEIAHVLRYEAGIDHNDQVDCMTLVATKLMQFLSRKPEKIPVGWLNDFMAALKTLQPKNFQLEQLAMHASVEGHAEMLHALLSAGANVNAVNSDGMTATMRAAENGNLTALRCLIAHRADLNKQCKAGFTAAILAANVGQVETLQCLIDSEAVINIQNNIGITAAMYAANGGHLDALQRLIKAGVDIDVKNAHGMCALVFAAGRGHGDVIQCLIDHGVDLHTQTPEGGTALIFAAMEGHVDAAQRLIDADADINADTNLGQTALMYSTFYEHFEMMNCLLASHVEIDTTDKFGMTALSYAAKNNLVGACQILIQAGANLEVRNHTHRTAIKIAYINKSMEAYRCLVAAGACLDDLL